MNQAPKATVPSLMDPLLNDFLRMHGHQGFPVFVDNQDLGYGASQCHVSAKRQAEIAGGERIHGWAIWKFTQNIDGEDVEVIAAEFHSVWKQPDGKLVDVTPPKFASASKVLFLADKRLEIQDASGLYLMPADQTNLPDQPYMHNWNPCPSRLWSLKKNDPALVGYLKQLGLPATWSLA